MGPLKSDYDDWNKQLITLTMITVSCFYCNNVKVSLTWRFFFRLLEVLDGFNGHPVRLKNSTFLTLTEIDADPERNL